MTATAEHPPLPVGNDCLEVVAHAVARRSRLALRARGDHTAYVEGVRRMIRAAGRRVADADPEDLVELVALEAEVDLALARAVARQRDRGVTWGQIGAALGVTKQAAAQRWGSGRR